MSRDGNGNYSLPESAFIGGTVINSTVMNSNLSDIATALTGSISADGQTTPTANLKMGNYKITGLGAGSALTDSCNISQQQNSFGKYAVSAGTDTITLALTPAITAYATGQRFTFKAGGTNTGATTLNINSLGAKTVKLVDGSALTAGVITLDRMIEVEYDGTDFILLNRFDSKTAAELSTIVSANKVYVTNEVMQKVVKSITASVSTTAAAGADVISQAFTPLSATSKIQVTVTGNRLYAFYDYGSSEVDYYVKSTARLLQDATVISEVDITSGGRCRSDGQAWAGCPLKIASDFITSANTTARTYLLKVIPRAINETAEVTAGATYPCVMTITEYKE